MYKLYNPVISNDVIKNFNQIEIYKAHFGEIKLGVSIRSPIREDKHPSCCLYLNEGNKLYLKDFATGTFLNIFELLMFKYKITFSEVLRMLTNSTFSSQFHKPLHGQIKKEKADIQIIPTVFTYKQLAYWNSYGITSHILAKYNVCPIKALWINGYRLYTYTEFNPAYAYIFSKEDYKIYFPQMKLSSSSSNGLKPLKFLSNTNKIQGLKQLPKTGNLLIITKSYKDVMVFDSFGIPAIAPQAESNILKPELISLLKTRFKKIIVLYDFDYAGIKGANKIHKDFGLERVFLTNGKYKTKDYKAKDPSDYRRYYGEKASWTLLNNLILTHG